MSLALNQVFFSVAPNSVLLKLSSGGRWGHGVNPEPGGTMIQTTDWLHKLIFSGFIRLRKSKKNTVALVMRKRDSWVTVSTSGELFIIVFTLASGKFAPPRGLDILLWFLVYEASTFFKNQTKFLSFDFFIQKRSFVYKF